MTRPYRRPPQDTAAPSAMPSAAPSAALVALLQRGLGDDEPVAPLWRAAQVFRGVGFLYALGFLVAVDADLVHPGLAWTLFGVLSAANVVWVAGYLIGFARNARWVAAELAVSAAMMLSTSYVADTEWIAHNQTWPTTLWMAGAVLSAALVGGARGGLAGAVIIGAANYFVKGEIILNFGRNATMILLAAAAVAVGLGASRARLTHERLTAAVDIAARSAERERLAREVHDGVLQVLALISRRGGEIGGPTAELAALAAEQERSLRRLIAAAPSGAPQRHAPDAHGRTTHFRTVHSSTTSGARRDIGAALRARATDDVHVSAPAEPVALDAATADEVLAAVRNILDNVQRHAGPAAQTYILVEDLDGEVVVSVRDDGGGIVPGRVQEAAAEGRMGISHSIVGRIEALGGTARLESAPGAGTEWELTVPVTGERKAEDR